jgi:hypothetical protein
MLLRQASKRASAEGWSVLNVVEGKGVWSGMAARLWPSPCREATIRLPRGRVVPRGLGRQMVNDVVVLQLNHMKIYRVV